MKNKKPKTSPPAPVARPNLPVFFVTLLVGLFATVLVLAQFHYAQNPNSQLALSNLARRAQVLEQVTNLVERDELCIPLAAYGRALDEALPAHARVFLSGMLGETNSGSLGYYFFLRNYLFPREVAISLNDQAVYHSTGFSGVSCDSPSVLRSNGFDLMIRYANNRLQLIPLTPKGMPKNK